MFWFSSSLGSRKARNLTANSRCVITTEDADSLKPVETMPDSGFESSVTLPEKYSYVSVQALDAAGRLLGTSSTVAVAPPPPAPPAG